eukprot:COSAG01_NODE_65769_length_272_cov_0.734104_1_plen_69_part_10
MILYSFRVPRLLTMTMSSLLHHGCAPIVVPIKCAYPTRAEASIRHALTRHPRRTILLAEWSLLPRWWRH